MRSSSESGSREHVEVSCAVSEREPSAAFHGLSWRPARWTESRVLSKRRAQFSPPRHGRRCTLADREGRHDRGVGLARSGFRRGYAGRELAHSHDCATALAPGLRNGSQRADARAMGEDQPASHRRPGQDVTGDCAHRSADRPGAVELSDAASTFATCGPSSPSSRCSCASKGFARSRSHSRSANTSLLPTGPKCRPKRYHTPRRRPRLARSALYALVRAWTGP